MFLDLNAEDVLCSDFFPNISEFLLSSIMQRNLRVQEEIKLEAILAWAESHSLPLEQGNILICKLVLCDLCQLVQFRLQTLCNAFKGGRKVAKCDNPILFSITKWSKCKT